MHTDQETCLYMAYFLTSQQYSSKTNHHGHRQHREGRSKLPHPIHDDGCSWMAQDSTVLSLDCNIPQYSVSSVHLFLQQHTNCHLLQPHQIAVFWWPLATQHTTGFCEGHNSQFELLLWRNPFLNLGEKSLLFLIACSLHRQQQWQQKALLYGKLREWARWTKLHNVIGYPSEQDGAILPARDYLLYPARKIPPEPCNKCFIDQVCLVKMAGYWPCSFFCKLMDLNFV